MCEVILYSHKAWYITLVYSTVAMVYQLYIQYQSAVLLISTTGVVYIVQYSTIQYVTEFDKTRLRRTKLC